MSPTSVRRRPSLRRAAVIGFVVGSVIPLPALVFALVSPLGETLLPVFVPGSILLRPLAAAMSSWPGAVNLLLTSVLNGLLFAVLFGLVYLLIRRRP
jgi:hypothetical protein